MPKFANSVMRNFFIAAALCCFASTPPLADTQRVSPACNVSLPEGDSPWTLQEVAAWNAICNGQSVSGSKSYALTGQETPIRGILIRTILQTKTLKERISPKGIRVESSIIKDLDLSFIDTDIPIIFFFVEFYGDIKLTFFRTSKPFFIDAIKGAAVDAQSAQFQDFGILARSPEGIGPIDLTKSTIRGSFTVSNFGDKDLILRRATISGNVAIDIDSPHRNIDMSDSIIDGGVELSGTVRKANLESSKIAKSTNIKLHIGSLTPEFWPQYSGFSAKGMNVSGNLKLEISADVLELSNLVATNALISLSERNRAPDEPASDIGKIELANSDISGSLVLSGNLHHVVLDGTRIGKVLRLDQVSWSQTSVLSAKRARVTIWEIKKADRAPRCDNSEDSALDIDGHYDYHCPISLPQQLELTNFRYDDVGVLTEFSNDPLLRDRGVNVETEMKTLSADWWKGFLQRQESFSPQPYNELAAILRAAGYKDTAEKILYFKFDREAANCSQFWECLISQMERTIIGYGLHFERALYWIISLVLLGAVVLRLSGQGVKHGMPYGLTYSFDMLVPVIKLRKSNDEVKLDGFVRIYFIVHRIIGYVLATFLIAFLSGIGK